MLKFNNMNEAYFYNVFDKNGNSVACFLESIDAFNYLRTVDIFHFVVISDFITKK
jgi:hypothetical protein